MKKFLIVLMALAVLATGAFAKAKQDSSSKLIKVGIVNNPPSESGYRAANCADMEKVFSTANGYQAYTFYNIKNDEQLNAASQFITDGVDYLLISAAATDGWDGVLKRAKEAGIKVFLFDRMINVSDDLYECAVVSDMAEEGKSAVQWLKDQKFPVYNVVHIQGAMGSDAQIGRTGALDKEFKAGTMKKVVQQTATWDESEAKKIVESVINSGAKFNVIYAENTGMAKGAVAALDEAGITHGPKGDVAIMAFDCDSWAMRDLQAGNWSFIQQCSPFQAELIDSYIKAGKVPAKKVINPERGFDAKTVTDADIAKYAW